MKATMQSCNHGTLAGGGLSKRLASEKSVGQHFKQGALDPNQLLVQSSLARFLPVNRAGSKGIAGVESSDYGLEAAAVEI